MQPIDGKFALIYTIIIQRQVKCNQLQIVKNAVHALSNIYNVQDFFVNILVTRTIILTNKIPL
jgi:hypothetical protein